MLLIPRNLQRIPLYPAWLTGPGPTKGLRRSNHFCAFSVAPRKSHQVAWSGIARRSSKPLPSTIVAHRLIWVELGMLTPSIFNIFMFGAVWTEQDSWRHVSELITRYICTTFSALSMYFAYQMMCIGETGCGHQFDPWLQWHAATGPGEVWGDGLSLVRWRVLTIDHWLTSLTCCYIH